MSEYIVQRNSLVNVADEIRVLSGATEELGLDEMASNVADANTTIDAQATTISEIAALLEGKSVPGGGGSVETCIVTITEKIAEPSAEPTVYYIDAAGNYQSAIVGSVEQITVRKNSIVAAKDFANHCGMTGNIEKIYYYQSNTAYYVYGDCEIIYA